MKRLKGTVKNDVVVLENGVHLPEGTEVDILVPTRRQKLKEAVHQILANPITRHVGMVEIIEENKRELDERWSFGERPEQ